MPSCNTYHLTWFSLTLDVEYLFTTAQQSASAAPYLGQVTPPDLERGVAPLGPPVPMQLLLLGLGISSLDSRP